MSGSDEKITLFLAKVDASHAGGIYGLNEEHEDIRVRVCDSADAFTALKKGYINNAFTIIALQWLLLNKAEIDAKWGDSE